MQNRTKTYLSELLSLLIPLCPVFVFLYGAEQEIDLGDNDLCERIRTDRTAGTRACASTESMGAVG